MVTETAEKKWIVKIGLNSSGDTDVRQEIYRHFVDKLEGLGLDVELRQSGIMSDDACEVLVEVSSPEEGNTFYELSTAADVERVIKKHLIGGRRISEMAVAVDSIDRICVKDKDKDKDEADSRSSSLRIDARQWKEAMDLLGIGIFMAVPIIGGVAIGLWLDNMWDTRPFVMIIGALVGTAIGFFGAYRTISLIINRK